jgi:hypothetical protein
MKRHLMEICLFGGGLVLCIGVWVTASYFEARAYKNVTGKEISTLDAMFVNLRVQGTANDN